MKFCYLNTYLLFLFCGVTISIEIFVLTCKILALTNIFFHCWAEKFLIFSPFPVRRSSRSVGSNLSSFWAGRVSCWPARCFRCFAKESEGWMASYHKMLVNTCWKTVVSCVFTGNRAGGVHSNLDIANKSIRPFLFTILNISLYQM